MDHKNKIIFLGKDLNRSNIIVYQYAEINEDNTLGKIWKFKSSLFKKGSIGSIFVCTLEKDEISYRSIDIPTRYIKIGETLTDSFIVFKELYQYEETSRQTDAKIKRSKKGDNLKDLELIVLRGVFKALKTDQQKAQFIGDLIFKITKK
jgi:hypothetical protein